eukprot:CAMPEP_0172557862 /NCGR_PEP_ID=MMETSP1067-20121228/75811_1 /TAXON_ID=265564 ORGANISM="Thalassiosira punctigera, Strain Tpunct2005C2" /NCGR_SAMPLE_ID=MMETSP1067 /ASSEMBLY_ACC=CAM_ASM_000444 /LENGTH=190 /DNA_ID=CAMNT_0013347067 /DNA_START=104 /DNA_END=672 /DNA_ORIENTATION=+
MQRGKEEETRRLGTQTMPQVKYVETSSGREDIKRYHAVQNSTGADPISIRTWMDLVSSKSPEGIRAASDLSAIIASSSYASMLFETPGASWTSSGRDRFEFALSNAPALKWSETNPHEGAFAEHFAKCKGNKDAATVCSFANLGGDALLVSPLPSEGVDDAHYSHLAAFVRGAPKSQVAEFWRLGAARFL